MIDILWNLWRKKWYCCNLVFTPSSRTFMSVKYTAEKWCLLPLFPLNPGKVSILFIVANSAPRMECSNSGGGHWSEMCFPAWLRRTSPLGTVACSAVGFGSQSSTFDFWLKHYWINLVCKVSPRQISGPMNCYYFLSLVNIMFIHKGLFSIHRYPVLG